MTWWIAPTVSSFGSSAKKSMNHYGLKEGTIAIWSSIQITLSISRSSYQLLRSQPIWEMDTGRLVQIIWKIREAAQIVETNRDPAQTLERSLGQVSTRERSQGWAQTVERNQELALTREIKSQQRVWTPSIRQITAAQISRRKRGTALIGWNKTH